MPQSLTKVKWGELKEVLLHVPIRARSAAWRESMEFIEQVLAGQNNLAPDVDVKNLKYSVKCDLCNGIIHLEDDYVFHAITGRYVHYDCGMKRCGPMFD